jgi:hypothetical protein
MKTTGLFTTHYHEIPFSKFGEPIYLIPFGDIHRNSPMCHEEKWKEFLGWAKGKKNAYFLGMGDYDDLASASERLLLQDPKLHESTRKTLDIFYKKSTEKLAKELSFMNGRLIGILGGNHYSVLMNSGITTDQYLADLLCAKYLGCNTFIKLGFSMTGKHNATMSLDIWAHHGKGASRLKGGSINRVQYMAECAEADIYLMGHDHSKGCMPMSRLYLASPTGLGTTPILHHRKMLLGRTGSFLRGYVENEVSYVADGAMNPTDLGVIKIEMTPKRDQAGDGDRIWIDLHASV